MQFKKDKLKRFLLVGGGGHAVSCSELIENNEQKIVGFFDKSKNATLQKYGYDYLGNDSEIIKYLEHDVMWVVAIGQIKSPIPRMTLFKYSKKNEITTTYRPNSRSFA